MATLERLSQPVPSSLADEGGPSVGPLVELAPEAPAPFPWDQLVALRNEPQQHDQAGQDPEVSISFLDRPPSSDGHLPPDYDEGETDPFVDAHHPHAHHHLPPHDDDDAHIPPTYPHEERPSFDYPRDKPSSSASSHLPASSSSSSDPTSEKMRLDLDSVTAAISRLYDVAPQMGDQRVELNARKRDEMDLARMGGRGKMIDQVAESEGKARETKEQELGQIWERIEQAHGRRLGGQEAEMRPSGSASAKKERDQKKQAFMEGVADRTAAGRMHGQDSSPPSIVDGAAVASSSSTTTKEQQDLITVGQFIRELGTNTVPPTTANRRTSASHTSTPPASSSSTPPSAASASNPPPTTSSRRTSFVPAFVEAALQRRASIKNNPSQDSLPDVGSPSTSRTSSRQVGHRYLAEFQESISVVQVHLELEEVPAESELEVVVVEGGEKEVRISSSSKDGWEIKIPLPGSARSHLSKVITTASNPFFSASTFKHTIPSSTISFRLPAEPSSSSSSSSSQPTFPPLSAPFLASLAPTSLACSTCSTPIVNTTLLLNPQTAYKDLPSEHWEELVGSWLCHDEMKIALGVEDGKGGGGGGGGFWPREGEVLVGGNYVLVGDGLLIGGAGVWKVREGAESETWQPIECSTCSSPLGRRFNHPSIPPTSTFKFQKYAIKPIGPSSSSSAPPPPTFPLSIFIASDLLELADVHRCYHFIVYSEEEPLVPLILIWLLNPSLQITLGSTSSPSTERSPFRAAKLMFQTSPSLLSSIPPAFDAAEPLHYPSSICIKLASELERSHASYPGRSGGGMMGLKGGWLERC